MKKLLVFLAILFVSVMSSACINNLAIQELNAKAKEYIEKGNYDEAIKRLESSVDLDGTIFESRYNLAVAYVNKEMYRKAVEQLEEIIKTNSKNPDVYYTLGVALEGEANQIIAKNKDEDNENLPENPDSESKENNINQKEAVYVVQKLKEAAGAYEKYLELAKNPEDFENVQKHIQELKTTADDFTLKFGV